MQKKRNFLLKILLFPVYLGYRFVVFWRNFFYDTGVFKSKEFQIPIISIGNILVGGTGKTPHTEMIVEFLKDDYNIAVLSRGYKRKSKGFLEVNVNSSFAQVGDEPLQTKRKFPEIIVAVCRNRAKGIEQLMCSYPDLNAIILDDAFQHRRVKPGISMLLNNFNIPLSNTQLLPYGYLREQRSAVHRADLIFVTKCPENMKLIERRIMLKEMDPRPYQTLFFSTYEYFEPKPVFESMAKKFPIDDNSLKIIAVSGIAYSNNFIKYLKTKSNTVIHLRFKDHHNFKKKDILKLETTYHNMSGNIVILTTEKDSVRLQENLYISDELKSVMYYIPIKVKMMGGKDDVLQLKSIFSSYVTTNKRYNKLYRS
ncbi:MAG: tetraacyldisaccharide 4'-kinase [Bacteroidales bacterium]|nr:tetraacyldisaccharide 4'-kinase [Bacteroidales bacterium]